MPYSYPDDVPDYVKELPVGAQKLFVVAYNSTYERTQDEDQSRVAGWGAVKTKYRKNAQGEWVQKAKEESMINLEELVTTQKAYAAHNRIHAEYVDARHGSRRKAQIQEDHEVVVRHILELGGRHLPKGDALDDTLPQELVKEVKLRYLGDMIELSDETPTRSDIQVLRTGTFHHPTYGKFTITDETLETMVKNFNESRPKAPTELVVDWEHMSTAEPPVKSPAAGWVKGLAQKDSGLFASVEWTEEAVDEIEKKEYRFISPEFDLNYRDKESGKRIGPTLISVALTNRPFLEGMEPVVLSEELGAMVFAEERSIEERVNVVRQAFYSQFYAVETRDYISEVFDDYVIVESGGELSKIPYIRDSETGKVVFDSANKVKVTLTKTYEEIQLSEKQTDEETVGTSEDPTICLAEWDAAYINDLPDKCFAYIKSGGEKDDDGKTVPRALRYLPYRDKDGKVDLPHLRNALSRLPQTKLTPEEKAKARKALISAAREAGVGEYSELPGVTESEWKEEFMEEKQLREALDLGEDADILEAVRAIKAKAEETDTLKTRVTELEGKLTASETKLTEAEADKVVDEALQDGKILPKMKEWAHTYVLHDPEGFKAFLEMTEKIGPDLTIKGVETGEGTIQLTASEKKAAKKLGVKEEDIIALKEADRAEQASS